MAKGLKRNKKKTSLTLRPQNGSFQIADSEENFLDTVSFESNRKRTSLVKLGHGRFVFFLKGQVDV